MTELEYFKGDELAASTWRNKYAAEGELNPDDTHRRLAKEFARIESEYDWKSSKGVNNLKLSNYGYQRPNLDEEAIYQLFKDFKYIIPGGSVMSGCGTGALVSLSNCFVIGSPKDSYAEIMKTRSQQAQLMKRRGGVGYDLSQLRPRGAKVNNAAKSSTGAASFMDVCSDITNEVAQNGRRGALMLSMSINHPDIEEFITKKQDLTKVTGANISVKVTDEFMQAVMDDKDYILRFPVDADMSKHNYYIGHEDTLKYGKLYNNSVFGFIKKVRARELWNTLMHCAWNTAEPGIMFEGAMHNYSPDGVYPDFKMVGTNPCQPAWATVLTPNGIKTFGEIKVGDIIWSAEGWTKIIRKQSSGIKEVLEYRTTAGSFYGTDTHRVVSHGTKVEAKDADDIDILAGEIVPERRITLDVQDIMDGLVIGDGSVHKASNNLVFLYIGDNDTDYFTSPIYPLIGEHRPALKNSAYEVKTTIKAVELPKTFLREIPERFFKGTSSVVCGFLKGLYSANGSVVGKRVTLKTSSPKLRDQVQIMLSSVGIRSYYTTNYSKEVEFNNGFYSCKESYDINISSDRDIFMKKIGFLQEYKMEKLEKTLRGPLSRSPKNHNIISADLVSIEEVFNITVDNNSHTYWTGGLNVSNCGEIPMGPFDSCRLIHINLASYIVNPFTDKAHIDEELLYMHSYEAMRLADDLVDLEIEAVDRIINTVKNDTDDTEFKLWSRIKEIATQGRRAGLGFTGLADAIAMLGLKYDSDEGISQVEQLMKIMFKGQLDSNIDMAIERGAFPAWDGNLEEESRGRNNAWYDWIFLNDLNKYKRMLLHGRRNISWSTVAPTGTVSIMAGTSSGIEPIFLPFYQRKRKCMSESDRVDYVDKVGEKYTLFTVVHPNLKRWAIETMNYSESEVNEWSLGVWKEVWKESPYYGSTAPEIDWRQRVKLQGVVQKYITHSISSTVNLAKETTEEEIADIYIEAWKQGLKGITIYRDGCREGVLTQVEKPKTIEGRQAPKRPKELEADAYLIKAKGEQFIILVGMLEGKPYEVFAFRPRNPISFKPHKGVITKVSKMHYSFTSDVFHIDNLELANENVEENAATLYSSMLLRHGVDIKYIVKTAKKVNDNITSFSSAMCRVLSKYIPNEEIKGEVCPDCGGTLIREGGCIHCKDCGYNRCN
jgi:ribonucleotide reductase alpha subunit